MAPPSDVCHCDWLCTGREVFPAMLEAIDAATMTVSLESYIYSASPIGDRFRDALIRACRRGVTVRVMVDGLGSSALPGDYWEPLIAAGGQARWFNPIKLHRMGIRDHRKILVCDSHVAFIGGFNIASEYDGDGVTCGWCDIGLKVVGWLACELQESFDEMFPRADFKHKRKLLLRRPRKLPSSGREQLLLSGPGLGFSPIKRALRRDFANARSVEIVVAYFLPSWRIRRSLMRIARQGGRVRLILAGKSDVAVSQLAGQSLYRRLLKAGIEIFEYQPQILHAKLFIIDDTVYVGSSNLDHRSLNINYELLVRFEARDFADRARAVFNEQLSHSRRITLEEWKKSRSLWQRIKQRWSYFLLARIDPFIARRQWRALPD
jgi:cardiolipin synthase